MRTRSKVEDLGIEERCVHTGRREREREREGGEREGERGGENLGG